MAAKKRYSMVGFGGRNGLLLLHGLTAGEAQREAEKADVEEYLLHPPYQARRKKPPGTRRPKTGPYTRTTCRRLVFRVLLDHRWKHVPDAEELETG